MLPDYSPVDHALEYRLPRSRNTTFQRLTGTWSPIAAAEELLAHSGAVIRHGGDRACYRPGDDVIQLPLPGVFPEASRYYNVELHELTHSTSHAFIGPNPALDLWPGYLGALIRSCRACA